MDNTLPFEIRIEKAKYEILHTVNQIGNSYDIPSPILIMLLEQIVEESKLNTYIAITTNYNISIPEGAVQEKPPTHDSVEEEGNDT